MISIDPEDMQMFIRTGLVGLVGVCFGMVRSVIKEFKKLKKDVSEGIHGDKMLSFRLEQLSAKVDDMQKTVNRILSIKFDERRHPRKRIEDEDDE